MPKVIWAGNTEIQIRGGSEYNRLARERAALTNVAQFWAFTDHNH